MAKRRYNMESEIAQRTAQVIIEDYEANIKEAAEEAREIAIKHFEKLLNNLQKNSVHNRFANYEVIYRPERGKRITIPGFGVGVTLPRFYVTIDGDTNGYNLYAILDEGRKAIPVPEGKVVIFNTLRINPRKAAGHGLPTLYPMTEEGSLKTRPNKLDVLTGVRGPHIISPVPARNFTELLTDDINDELKSLDNPIRFDVSRRD